MTLDAINRRLRSTAVVDAISARKTARVVANMPRPGAYRAFVPKKDDMLAVTFPGELIRVPVKSVINDDTVLIHLDSVPMAKSHRFEFKEVYGCRRRVKDGRDWWEAQYEQDFLAEQQRKPGTVRPRKVEAPVIVESPKPLAKGKASAKKSAPAKKGKR